MVSIPPRLPRCAAGFTEETLDLLVQPLDPGLVSVRPGADGRAIAFVEGARIIAQANRIFGYGRWGSEIVGPIGYREFRSRTSTDERSAVGVYWARVRVRVAGCESRSDVGCAVVAEDTPDAHEMAIKAAVTDGTKRSLRNYGPQFGSDLYERSDPGRLAAERELADLRAAVLAVGTHLGLDEAETRVQASERSGRPFVEIGVRDLASLLRAMAERLGDTRRAA